MFLAIAQRSIDVTRAGSVRTQLEGTFCLQELCLSLLGATHQQAQQASPALVQRFIDAILPLAHHPEEDVRNALWAKLASQGVQHAAEDVCNVLWVKLAPQGVQLEPAQLEGVAQAAGNMMVQLDQVR